MALPKAYSTFADFEREEIRPGMRAGWSMDELSNSNESVIEFDMDPFEAALEKAEAEEEDLDD